MSDSKSEYLVSTSVSVHVGDWPLEFRVNGGMGIIWFTISAGPRNHDVTFFVDNIDQIKEAVEKLEKAIDAHLLSKEDK